MDVVGAVLGVVVLDQGGRAMDAEIVSLARRQRARPGEAEAAELLLHNPPLLRCHQVGRQGADEAVDGMAVLEPLRLTLAVRLAGAAGSLPDNLVLRLGMPIPHATAGFGVEQPLPAVARLGPADLQGIRLAGRASRLHTFRKKHCKR